MATPRPEAKKKIKRASKDTKGAGELRRGTEYTRLKRSTAAKDTKGPDLKRGQEAAKPIIKQERIKHLRKTRTRFSVKAELEGRGVLAKGLKKVADANSNRNTISGRADAALGLKDTILDKGTKDLVNLPAQVVPSVYVPVAGVVEAAQGRPKRIKQFAKDIDKHDPVYNLAAAGVDIVQGKAKAAGKRLKRSQKAFDEHPGFALAEGYGVRGAVGGGAGAVMRSGVTGKTAKRVASTEREPLKVEGTSIEVPRSYPKDVIRKGLTVHHERRKRREATDLRKQADAVEKTDAPNAADQAVRLRRKANRVDPDVVSGAEIKRRVDERVAVNEDIRRTNRTKITHSVRVAVKPAKKGRGVVSIVAQNISRATPEDLAAYLGQLKEQHSKLDRAGKYSNEQMQRAIRRAIDHGDMSHIEAAARRYEEVVAPLQEKLTARGLLDKDQAERAKLIPYAVQHMGAKHDREKGIVDADGAPLSTSAIRAHMKANGHKEPAFVTQAPNQRGAKNFNIRSERVQGIVNRRRTGEATRGGTFDAHPETLVENAARMQGLVDATDGFRGFVGGFAHRGDTGRVKTFQSRSQAERAARNIGLPGERQWRAIRINPFQGSKEQLASLLEHTDSQIQHEGLVESMKDALDGKGEGPWALIPEEAASRLQEHLNSMGTGAAGKAGQLVNQSFRKTVLATSPSWALGNVVEAGFRSALAKAGPTSYIRGRKLLKAADEETRARTVGGGYAAFADRTVKRSAEQFTDTFLEDTAQVLGQFWRTPGPKHLAQAWNIWTHHAFNTMRLVESQFQTAMLGKAATDRGLFKRGTLELSQKIVDELDRTGKVSENTAAALGRDVDRMYGQYGKWSPTQRAVIANYTPFLAWSRNAALFVADVLPKDHPVALAVIAASENATEEWRREHGLDQFSEGALPGWLQGSLPLKGGGHQRSPNRYLPFGAFSDPTGTAAGLIMPQMRSTIFAAMGMDWMGNKLRNGSGNELDPREKGLAAAKAFLESTVPLLAQGGRVSEGGIGKLNPLAPVKPKPKKGGTGIKLKKRSGFDFGGQEGGFDFSGGEADFDFGG